MNTIFQSLSWKEWHEQKWKLAALAATLSGVAACLLIGNATDLPTSILRVTLAICIVPLAIFIGLNSASGERSGGTMPFLQALPVPMWRVALHKLFFGAVSVVVPVLLMLLLVYFGRELLARIGFDIGDLAQFEHQNDDVFSFRVKNWFLDTGLVLSVLAASFYIWAAAGGVNRKDEISAGAVALVVMLLWFIAVIYVNYCFDRWGRLPTGKVADSAMSFELMTVSTLPGGLLSTAEKSSRLEGYLFIVGIGIAVVVHLALATWYILRFGASPMSRFARLKPRLVSPIGMPGSPRPARRRFPRSLGSNFEKAVRSSWRDWRASSASSPRFFHSRGLKEIQDRSEKSIPPSRSPWAL